MEISQFPSAPPLPPPLRKGHHTKFEAEVEAEEMATPPPLPPPLPFVSIDFQKPPAEHPAPQPNKNRVMYVEINFAAMAALTETRRAREQELSENNHDSSDRLQDSTERQRQKDIYFKSV